MKDYYAILGISPNVEPEVITAAYKSLVKKYHPDVYNGTKKDSEKRIREINEAYSILSNKSKKTKYDDEFLKNKSTGNFSDFNNSEFNDDGNIFDNDWNILIEVFPNAENIRLDLSQLSQKLSFMYQLILLEQKMGGKAKKVADELKNDFLQRYFGKNMKVQELAYKALVNNEIEIAKEINKKIALLGNDAALNVIQTMSKKLNEKLYAKKSQPKTKSKEQRQTSKYQKTGVDHFFQFLIIAVGILTFSFFILIIFMQ